MLFQMSTYKMWAPIAPVNRTHTYTRKMYNIIRSDKISRRHKNQINEMDNYSSSRRTCLQAYDGVAAIQFVERQH